MLNTSYDHPNKVKSFRNEEMLRAHIKYGFKVKEVAEHLGIHCATVSMVVKGAEDKN